ncbi:transposable element Tcb2 transposase [Trichonephila clavipes]|nr:transposable element Tcb2 transposase [Trichonephila clavipes]
MGNKSPDQSKRSERDHHPGIIAFVAPYPTKPELNGPPPVYSPYNAHLLFTKNPEMYACSYVLRSFIQAEIAQAIGVSQSVISRIWNRFLETESAGRRPGRGRRRATTSNEDRYLVLTARRHRNMNATLLQQQLRSAPGTTVSTQTVRNQRRCGD